MIHPRLSDEQENAFHANLEAPPPFLMSVRARFTGQNRSGALLKAMMAKPDQIRFKRIVRQLGARGVRPREQMPYPALSAALLEHGAALDRTSCRASWARLPVLYAAARAALESAMAIHAPRKGACGLVLGALSAPTPHDARLTLTWIYARKLGDETEQVHAIRARALEILAPPTDTLATAARRAAGRVLDPHGIIRND